MGLLLCLNLLMTTIKYRGRHIPNRRDAAAVATVSS